MHYNRLYFYAVGQDYLDLLEQFQSVELNIFTQDGDANPDVDISLAENDRRMWFLSLKPIDQLRRNHRAKLTGIQFSDALFDVVSWARGYIYKEQQLVGHMIQQTLPRFDRPSPTEEHLQEFEDARALKKVMSLLRKWMKKNWIDHYGDGDFFGLEALRLKLEEGYADASLELDNMPTTTYVLPNSPAVKI